ncbi:MAG: globin family protein [Proteobacteria bacterium]|nr:globin family protein [Pseudomonadota bacterium]
MQPNQIDLVQNTFKSVVPIKEVAAELFYKRLFELDPSLESMFTGDMREQGQKLMSAIALVVGGLKNWERVEATVRELGVRHVDYGVKPEHYVTVGAALIWTLQQGLGDAFTDEVKQAWSTAYEAIATTMMDAAKSRAA